jgi:hypothetical protein
MEIMERIWVIGGKAIKIKTTMKERSRWVDNIKMDLRKIALGVMDWIELP